MSELRRLQHLHVVSFASLIKFGVHLGLEFGLGQALRTQLEADANAAAGKGISNSLHLIGLAVDLKAYRDGAYLDKSEDYAELGAYWKTLAPECCWGGDFKDAEGRPKPDGNHFSVTFGGRK